MKRSADYYDAFSDGYERGRDRGYHAMIDSLEAAAVLPHVPGARVLEAGCGTGLILERLRDAGGELFGADLSHGMLRRAAARGFRVARADLCDLPYRDGSFDVVYSFKVLAHVREVRRALGEMARVTRPGGRILAEFYHRLSLRHLVRVLKGARPVARGTTDREVFTRYDGWREIMGMVPPSCVLEGVRGVRIWTALPWLAGLPILGAALAAVERRSADGPLKRFAGFVILRMRKRG